MVSFLSRDTFDKIRHKPLIQNTVQHCVGINGLPLAVDGIVQASLTFHGNSDVYSGNFLVSDQLFSSLECVLGWDLVGRYGKTLITPIDEALIPISPPQTLNDSALLKSSNTPEVLS